MNFRYMLYTGILFTAFLTGCNYTPTHQQPVTNRTYSVQQETLEQRVDPVYMELYKNTSQGVPMLYVRNKGSDKTHMQVPVGIGATEGWETPTGTYEIPGVFRHPIWHPPEWSSREGPVRHDENSPLGNWMFILLKTDVSYDKQAINSMGEADSGYRIHSTNNPDSVGKKVTHGCVRVHPERVDELAKSLLNHMTRKDYNTLTEPGYKSTWRGKYKAFDEPVRVHIYGDGK